MYFTMRKKRAGKRHGAWGQGGSGTQGTAFLSIRPISRNARARSCWRGEAANFRRSWLGGMRPATMVPALRSTSGQLPVIVVCPGSCRR